LNVLCNGRISSQLVSKADSNIAFVEDFALDTNKLLIETIKSILFVHKNMDYHKYSDTRIRVRDGKIEWVDHGEIREISPESAEWLAEEFAEAAVLAKKQERSSC